MDAGVAILEIPWRLFRTRQIRRLVLRTYLLVWLLPTILCFIGQLVETGQIVAGGTGDTRWGFLAFLTGTVVATGVLALGVNLLAGTVTAIAATITGMILAVAGPWLGDYIPMWTLLGVIAVVPAAVEWRLHPRRRSRSLVGGIVRLVVGAVITLALWLLTMLALGALSIVVVMLGTTAGVLVGRLPQELIFGLPAEIGLILVGSPILASATVAILGLIVGVSIGFPVFLLGWVRPWLPSRSGIPAPERDD